MKIVHFSDWHGRWQKLPDADLYVCTGDMLPNTKACFWEDKEPERLMQAAWLKAHPIALKAPVMIVRGNHDYIDLTPLFEAPLVVEFKDKPFSFRYDGILFGGFRGVLPIADTWADEISDGQIAHRAQVLGMVDVLLTHCPPRGGLDNEYGSESLRNYLDFNVGTVAHLFGHVHESAGMEHRCRTLLSNAACQVNEIEI